MAIVTDPILLRYVRGTLGKQITIYERNGQIIMAAKRGPSKKKPTTNQLASRERMRIAAAYAKGILKDPDVKAYYAAKAGPGQNAYNMAVKDAYSLPEIQSIEIRETDAQETVVEVRVKEEFRVEYVEVVVKDAQGQLVERGRAQLGWNGAFWVYKAGGIPEGGKVVVTAVDMPGNAVVKEVVVQKEVPG